MSATTKTRTYVGQSGTRAHDGFAGFVIGRQCELRYERDGGQVRIALEHGYCAFEVPPLVVSGTEFEKWWVR